MLNPYNLYHPMQFQSGLNGFLQPQRIPRVKGRDGANAYPMAPGSEVLLLDLDDPIVWLVQTDDAGLKAVDGLDISLHKSEEEKAKETLDSFESRLKKIEEALARESRAVDVAYTEE